MNVQAPVTAQDLIQRLKTDCFHYRGHLPCAPHTRSGETCTCQEYVPVKRRGVIIKLGAAGDVLRTTPLLRALAPAQTGTHVLWVTHSPELLPKEACEAVKPDAATLARLSASEWDFCWNLDKDVEACALASVVRARERAGYALSGGVPFPVDERAWHKFATGIDNPYSKANQLSYVQEIFDIVSLPFAGEEYWLAAPSDRALKRAKELLPGDEWVGLNTGAGWRWPTRIWPKSHWAELISLLKAQNIQPVILGGPEEAKLNGELAAETGCLWPGVQSLDVFQAIIQRCQCLVTSVTQAMHLAIAARTPLVLFNTIFNANEFELYGRGEIVGPPAPCECYYAPVCRTGRNCTTEITPERSFEAVLRALQRQKALA
ncbi:MAG TPA: glycosyltransferase family 9 protein [Candidatus Methylacidiphilales bacterium]